MSCRTSHRQVSAIRSAMSKGMLKEDEAKLTVTIGRDGTVEYKWSGGTGGTGERSAPEPILGPFKANAPESVQKEYNDLRAVALAFKASVPEGEDWMKAKDARARRARRSSSEPTPSPASSYVKKVGSRSQASLYQ